MATTIHLLLLWTTIFQTTTALTGYLCNGNAPNVTTVSTTTIGSCDTHWDEPDTTEVYIQLLQRDEYQPTGVISCKVMVDQTIRYCGMHSHVSVVHGGEMRFNKVISRDMCFDMIKYGQINYDGFVMRDLIVNATNHRSLTLVGSVADDGSCTGATFLFNEHEYKNVFVVVKLEISLFQFSASYKIVTDQLVLPTTTACPYRKSSCIDVSETYFFWSVTSPDSCKFDEYSILYEGISTRVSANTSSNPTIYFVNTTDNIQFGLAKASPLSLCGYTIFSTEHPKFFIFETFSRTGFTRRRSFDVHNILFSAYFNTKLAYFARHVKTQFETLYKDSLYHRCMLARQIILNSISQLDNQPDMFALAVMKRPGFTAVAAGEVAHIIQCQPLQCRIRPSTFCYKELPVTCSNHTFFLKPNTKILVPLGTPRDCNNLIPTIFETGNTWIRVNPNATVTLPPKIIQPMEIPTWNYQEISNFITSGVYSYDDVEMFDDHLIFPLKRQALLESVARRLASLSHPIENGNFQNLFDEEVLEKLSKSYFDKLFSGFLKFGSFCAGILGIVFILQLFKSLLDILVHGYTLYTIYGWSLKLFGAVFSSVTNLLIHKSKIYPITSDQKMEFSTQEAAPTSTSRRSRRDVESYKSLPIARPRRERSVEELELRILNQPSTSKG